MQIIIVMGILLPPNTHQRPQPLNTLQTCATILILIVKVYPQIQAAIAKYPVTFYAWDLLTLNGRDLRKLPLTDRQRILADVYGETSHYRSVLTVESAGKALFDVIKAWGMEGIVAKRKDSKYISERSVAWQKIINWTYADVYITGWRKGEFGWLVAVTDSSGKLRSAGIIEFGVTPWRGKRLMALCNS
jgi:DNA ligase 1